MNFIFSLFQLVFAKQKNLEQLSQPSLVLFGSPVGWSIGYWKAVDDRVRGGMSKSHIKLLDAQTASFYGHLDTETLGGAGFASQKFWFTDPLVTDWSEFTKLCVELDERSRTNMILTINLYDNEPGDRGDGRNSAGVLYKTTIDPKLDSRFSIDFKDFVPTFKGRDKPDAKPLDLKNVLGISLMVQSFFDLQKGDFDIAFKSIKVQ